MRLPLSLDNYLLQFPTFKAVKDILDKYYENDVYIQPRLDYKQLIKDKFHIAYQICSIIETSTSYKDIWAILNYVYATKGVVNAIRIFCEYLGLTCSVTEDDDTHKTITLIGNLSTLSVNSFLVYMQELVQELIFINKENSVIRIDDLIINYDVQFSNSSEISQILVSQLEASGDNIIHASF